MAKVVKVDGDCETFGCRNEAVVAVVSDGVHQSELYHECPDHYEQIPLCRDCLRKLQNDIVAVLS